jgi:hypothetical protein
MHRKKAVTFAAVLLLVSTSAGFAQGTGGPAGGHAPTPGIGVGGRAPTPGTGMGSAPTPGIGTGGSMNSSDTLPGNPSGTAPRASPDNPSVPIPRAAPKIGETQDADVKAEYLEAIPYKPCPANVRFSNGRQACLGLPGYPYSRSYRSNE